MSNTTPTCPVSVVLPSYNDEATVAMAIRSAAFQTRPPAEIIILDDGSTDKTKDVIQNTIDEIKDQTPSKIHFHSFDYNQGVYPLRNLALNEATQPFIAFLDSDDYWHPQKLEIQHGFFERDPDLALCCHGVIDREGGPDTLPLYDQGFEPSSKILEDRHILMRNVMVTITIMIKKNDKIRFDESKPRGSDMLYWLEVVLSGGKGLWLRETLSFTQKPLYGASGLSGNVWKAEMAHQHNIHMLHKKSYISLFYCFFLRAFSFAKMLRRYGVLALR